jgi:hypothetical protein
MKRPRVAGLTHHRLALPNTPPFAASVHSAARLSRAVRNSQIRPRRSRDHAEIGLGTTGGKGSRGDIMNARGRRWRPAEKGSGEIRWDYDDAPRDVLRHSFARHPGKHNAQSWRVPSIGAERTKRVLDISPGEQQDST